MQRSRYRTKLEHILNHSAVGAALGMFMAVAVLIGSAGKVQALAMEPYGTIKGPLSLIVGCSVLVGVGSAITGYIFDEVDRS
jgi:hypothetical protein